MSAMFWPISKKCNQLALTTMSQHTASGQSAPNSNEQPQGTILSKWLLLLTALAALSDPLTELFKLLEKLVDKLL
jgi:hypothetical protein